MACRPFIMQNKQPGNCDLSLEWYIASNKFGKFSRYVAGKKDGVSGELVVKN